MGEMISDESAYTQAFWSFPLIPIAYIELVIVEIWFEFDLCMYLNAAVRHRRWWVPDISKSVTAQSPSKTRKNLHQLVRGIETGRAPVSAATFEGEPHHHL